MIYVILDRYKILVSEGYYTTEKAAQARVHHLNITECHDAQYFLRGLALKEPTPEPIPSPTPSITAPDAPANANVVLNFIKASPLVGKGLPYSDIYDAFKSSMSPIELETIVTYLESECHIFEPTLGIIRLIDQ